MFEGFQKRRFVTTCRKCGRRRTLRDIETQLRYTSCPECGTLRLARQPLWIVILDKLVYDKVYRNLVITTLDPPKVKNRDSLQGLASVQGKSLRTLKEDIEAMKGDIEEELGPVAGAGGVFAGMRHRLRLWRHLLPSLGLLVLVHCCKMLTARITGK